MLRVKGVPDSANGSNSRENERRVRGLPRVTLHHGRGLPRVTLHHGRGLPRVAPHHGRGLPHAITDAGAMDAGAMDAGAMDDEILAAAFVRCSPSIWARRCCIRTIILTQFAADAAECG